MIVASSKEARAVHTWLHKISVAYVPGPTTPLLDGFVQEWLEYFQGQGHTVVDEPYGHLDVLLTTAAFGEPVSWRKALIFHARKRFHLENTPLVFTLLHATPQQFQGILDHFARGLAKAPPDPADFSFPGLTSRAFHTLYEQGKRGGPILSIIRLLQSQAMCIRLVLVIGASIPEAAYTFDLVGAHPRTGLTDRPAFFDDLMLRIVTAASTHEVTDHRIVGDPIGLAEWRSLTTPAAMIRAGCELGQRSFFTEMVSVTNLVNTPAVGEAVASQYSEGCYATWDPVLNALVTTVTGSARPIDKDNLTEDELAIIVGLRPDGLGALIRKVEGKRNDLPSSEAVEMVQIDNALPKIRLGIGWSSEADVPVIRSKLHGHRGVKAFDPRWVEHVRLDEPYYHYPVSCSTEAQARAIQAAFARSEALNTLADPRQVVFTVLPGHGVVITEKWVAGKAPFQVIWECIDAGILQVDNLIPQGPLAFVSDGGGRMVVTE